MIIMLTDKALEIVLMELYDFSLEKPIPILLTQNTIRAR